MLYNFLKNNNMFIWSNIFQIINMIIAVMVTGYSCNSDKGAIDAANNSRDQVVGYNGKDDNGGDGANHMI